MGFAHFLEVPRGQLTRIREPAGLFVVASIGFRGRRVAETVRVRVRVRDLRVPVDLEGGGSVLDRHAFEVHLRGEGAVRVQEVEAGRCPVCGDGLGEACVRCSRCDAAHHRDCWEYARGCATYGCRAA